jgi:hypothetical protein
MTYQADVKEHRLLTILEILNEQTDKSLNTMVLTDALDSVGFGELPQVIEADVDLLKSLGTVQIEKIRSKIIIVTVSDLGIRVVNGKIHIAGIKFAGRG